MKTEREPQRAINATDYAELNTVLGKLVADVRAILSENFCGAYLQGSFALGEADEHSDVDFLIVTHEEVGEGPLSALQPMHKRIYGLETEWAQHLEGSYFPKERLRQLDDSHTPLLYLDNGASELISDNHCNTAVVRWTLREQGITLDGPDPKGLVDPVPADELRGEAQARMPEYAAWAREGPMTRWKQPYLVLTFCRLLSTLKTGKISTKREAAEWAIDHLNLEWSSLIRQALQDRADPWLRVHQQAESEQTERTLAFAEYALTRI
jgi:predicted nucleotidyltransferase